MTSNTLVREPVGVTLSAHRVAPDDDNEDEFTELQLAAEAGHTQDVNALFEAYAHPNVKNGYV